jgi:hypothetical protein
MDTHANVKELVSLLRNFEREGYEHEAGRVGELIHGLVEGLEIGHPVPSNIDELWLETEAVA